MNKGEKDAKSAPPTPLPFSLSSITDSEAADSTEHFGAGTYQIHICFSSVDERSQVLYFLS